MAVTSGTVFYFGIVLICGLLITNEVSGRRSKSSRTTISKASSETVTSSSTTSGGSSSVGTPLFAAGNRDVPIAQSANTHVTKRCPSVQELPMEMCMVQTRQDGMPCGSDDDCFIPNHVCCPHYCGTSVCKNTKRASSGTVEDTVKKSIYKGKRVPTNIKHRQNVPTIDELARKFFKGNVSAYYQQLEK